MSSLALSRRARVKRSELTTCRHYKTLDGRAELVEVRWHDPRAYGVYWLAIIHDPPIIQRRRTRKAAELVILSALNLNSRKDKSNDYHLPGLRKSVRG